MRKHNLHRQLLVGEEEENFIQAYNNSSYILLKIKNILESKIDYNLVTKRKDFEGIGSSWPYQRAWKDGYVMALKEVLEYLPKDTGE